LLQISGFLSSTNKTDFHDEIMLNVALNTKTLNPYFSQITSVCRNPKQSHQIKQINSLTNTRQDVDF
jgi:hypothetical protein